MKQMTETCHWKNQHATGYDYSFLWGKVHLEYEYSHNCKTHSWFPCYLLQIGGDHILQESITWLGRSLTIRIGELRG